MRHLWTLVCGLMLLFPGADFAHAAKASRRATTSRLAPRRPPVQRAARSSGPRRITIQHSTRKAAKEAVTTGSNKPRPGMAATIRIERHRAARKFHNAHMHVDGKRAKHSLERLAALNRPHVHDGFPNKQAGSYLKPGKKHNAQRIGSAFRQKKRKRLRAELVGPRPDRLVGQANSV